jgi:hypothetical protein
MPKFNVGDHVKVLDKPNWPDGGYKLANWEGMIVEVIEDPAGFVIMKADKTGYNMMFHEKELEQIRLKQWQRKSQTMTEFWVL